MTSYILGGDRVDGACGHHQNGDEHLVESPGHFDWRNGWWLTDRLCCGEEEERWLGSVRRASATVLCHGFIRFQGRIWSVPVDYLTVYSTGYSTSCSTGCLIGCLSGCLTGYSTVCSTGYLTSYPTGYLADCKCWSSVPVDDYVVWGEHSEQTGRLMDTLSNRRHNETKLASLRIPRFGDSSRLLNKQSANAEACSDRRTRGTNWVWHDYASVHQVHKYDQIREIRIDRLTELIAWQNFRLSEAGKLSH